jgi:hypothetical protein
MIKQFKWPIFIFVVFCSVAVAAQNKGVENDTIKKAKIHFEVSFGQSLLFISHTKQTNIVVNASVVIPTNAMLFFVELRPEKLIRIPIFFNLATESKQFLINGQLINEKAAPTLGTGATIKVFKSKIDHQSKIEFELGPLISCLINRKNSIQLAPVIAARLKIIRGENFIMYIGSSYSFGINALGLLYGTGTSF